MTRRAAARILAPLAFVALASCGGGGGPKPISDETDCGKLGRSLLSAYSARDADKTIEVSNRMDALSCPSPSS